MLRHAEFEAMLREMRRFGAYNGPVDESKIAARKRGRGAGNKTCASAAPAPADCANVSAIKSREWLQAYLAPYSDLYSKLRQHGAE